MCLCTHIWTRVFLCEAVYPVCASICVYRCRPVPTYPYACNTHVCPHGCSHPCGRTCECPCFTCVHAHLHTHTCIHTECVTLYTCTDTYVSLYPRFTPRLTPATQQGSWGEGLRRGPLCRLESPTGCAAPRRRQGVNVANLQVPSPGVIAPTRHHEAYKRIQKRDCNSQSRTPVTGSNGHLSQS